MTPSLSLLDLPDDILNHIHKKVKQQNRKEFMNKIYKMDTSFLKNKVNTYLKNNNLPLKPYGTVGEYIYVIDTYRIKM